MLKMFSTQLTGLFKRLQEKEEMAIEDSARLLAQAAAGTGKIYIYGTNEMSAVGHEATEGTEPLKESAIWDTDRSFDDISDTDRFLIIARSSADTNAVKLGKYLAENYIPFVSISAYTAEGGESLAYLADIHIDLRLTKGLLPDEEGNRFGYPSSMAALFVYYGIRFTIEEIMAEYE